MSQEPVYKNTYALATQAFQDGKAILDRAKAEGRELSEQEGAKAESLFTRSEELKVEGDRQKLDWMCGRADKVINEDPTPGIGLDDLKKFPPGRPRGPNPPEALPIPGRGGKKRYSELFGDALAADTGGFQSWAEFCDVVAHGLADSRLKIGSTQLGGQGSSGGFAVPSGFSRMFLDSSLETEVVRPRAKVYPMVTDDLRIPGFDSSDSSSTTFGGFDVGWQAEGATATRSTGKIRAVLLQAKKLSLYVAASSELVADGAGFGEQLGEKMQEALGFGLDSAFISGTGSGQPLGILNAGSTITVSKETSQTADTIEYANLIKMYARLLPRSVRRAVWIVHPSTLPQLLNLSVRFQNVGETDYIGGSFIPALREDGTGRMYILGREVVISEKASPLGDAGDIILADLSLYGIGMRSDIVLERSNAPGWLSDVIDFRVKLRVDGQPLMEKAYTPSNGSDTLSWAVVLEART